MNTTATQQLDASKADAFAQKMIGVFNDASLALMVSIGHRTHLFDTMATLPPSTSEQIARAARLDERYVREWLGTLVTGRVVDYDPERATYVLPPEHASQLTRAASPNNLAVTAQFIPVMAQVEDEIVECFRNGGGVPYSSYPRFHEVMAEESAQTVVAGLFEHILPLAPGIAERLGAGIDVLDVGCGSGRAIIAMGERFPRSRFILPPCASVQLERALVVLLQRRVLLLLPQEAVADRERLDVGAHEAAERILGGADDRLAAHVEGGVHDDRAARLLLEPADQLPVPGVRLLVHRLDARRIVDVRHRRDRGARHVQLLDSEELLLLLGHPDPVLGLHVRHEQHVRALLADVEVLRRVLGEHRRRERAEALAVLHLQVERLLHGRRAGVAEDRAAAERARAELHAAREPRRRLPAREPAPRSSHDTKTATRRPRSPVDRIATMLAKKRVRP